MASILRARSRPPGYVVLPPTTPRRRPSPRLEQCSSLQRGWRPRVDWPGRSMSTEVRDEGVGTGPWRAARPPASSGRASCRQDLCPPAQHLPGGIPPGSDQTLIVEEIGGDAPPRHMHGEWIRLAPIAQWPPVSFVSRPPPCESGISFDTAWTPCTQCTGMEDRRRRLRL